MKARTTSTIVTLIQIVTLLVTVWALVRCQQYFG
jgi:hypothetical protein